MTDPGTARQVAQAAESAAAALLAVCAIDARDVDEVRDRSHVLLDEVWRRVMRNVDA